MLGVLQILAFASTYKDYMMEVTKYASEDENCHFPLCATLLGMTKFVLDQVREGKLNDMINQEK